MNAPSEIMQIPIEDIIPNRFQPRLAFDEKALQELSASIKQHGIIQPLVVRRLGEKYEIIAGERRYKAATMAGLTAVPAVITVIDDQTSAEVALVENVQRKDLTAIEEAKSYKNLLDKGGLTQEELAKKMGLSQSAVANKLRLLNLSPKVQDALLNEKISERHARSLLSLSIEQEQDDWLNKIISERLTVRQLDTMLKKDGTEEEEDVPLVNLEQNIEEIKTTATDIIPDNSPILKDPKEQTNRFFNFLEEEPVQMGPTAPVNVPFTPVIEPTIPNFNDINQEQETKENTGLFEEIETLDSEEPDVIGDMTNVPSENNIDSISQIEMLDLEDDGKNELSTSFGDILTTIRKTVENLNANQNILIEELDLGQNYKINITINKE